MHIKVERLNKTFNGYHASRDVSFEIRKGKLAAFLGPSGSGKTTILRMLAGLEYPDSGDIRFDGRKVNDAPPRDRGIGFVFQNYALFRHMSVYDNIAFGLTVQKIPKADIRRKVEQLIELTGLHGLANRLPHQLSGGQRQRVAFARALAPDPSLLLLDEPFAAIDAKVRKELRTWLKDMIKRVGITTIFVTHDQDEAVEVADEILIIRDGRVEQHGTPIDIYKRPASPFVASFVGESNVLDAPTLIGYEHVQPLQRVLIRPEFIQIGTAQEIPLAHASERAVVRDVSFRGTTWHVEAELGSRHRLFAYRSVELPELSVGDEIRALIHRIYAFDDGKIFVYENRLKTDPMPVHI